MKELTGKAAFALLHTCMLGTDRRGAIELPEPLQRSGVEDETALLDAVAIISLRARVTARWPTVPLPDAVDARPELFVPQALREAVRALLDVPDAKEDPLARRALGALQDAGLRLHPFDHRFVVAAARAHPDRLHPDDRALLAPRAGDEVTAENWLSVTPSVRDAWLRRLRMVDPAAVRELIASDLASAPADVRSSAFAVLGLRLSPADRSVIEAFEKDRSGKVKAMVKAFLACMPGTEGYAERLDDLLDNFKVKKKGLLRKRHLSYRNPSRDDATCAEDTVALRASDLAEALALGPTGKWPELDNDIELALAAGYVVEGVPERAARLAEAAGADWLDLLGALDARGVHYAVDRECLADTLDLMVPGRWSAGQDLLLDRLQDVWPEGLPETVANRLLDRVPDGVIAENGEALAAMLTPAAFVALTRRFPAVLGRRLTHYTHLIETLATQEAP